MGYYRLNYLEGVPMKYIAMLMLALSFNSFSQELPIEITDKVKINNINTFSQRVGFTTKALMHQSQAHIRQTGKAITHIEKIEVVQIYSDEFDPECTADLIVTFNQMQTQEKVRVQMDQVYADFSCEYLTNPNAVLIEGESALSGTYNENEKVVQSMLNYKDGTARLEVTKILGVKQK